MSNPAKMAKKRKADSEAVQDETVKEEDNEISVETAGEAEDQPEEEVEAISHKELRKRRKLEKKKASQTESTVEADDHAAPDDESAGATTRSAAKDTKDTKQKTARSAYGVWVGNLAFATDSDKLQRFFESCGTITRMNMPKGNGKLHHNKGFAYVDFETAESVTAAVALSEKNLDGRRLLIKDAKSYEGRPESKASAVVQAALAADGPQVSGPAGPKEARPQGISRTARRILDRQQNPPAPTLFIGNLGFETTEDAIREMFTRNWDTSKIWHTKTPKAKTKKRRVTVGSGEDEDSEGSSSEDERPSEDEEKADAPNKEDIGIRKIRMGTFEDTGKCKGWAFVDFHKTSQATFCLIDGRNHRLNGRELKVEYASADAVRRGGGRMVGQPFDSQRSRPPKPVQEEYQSSRARHSARYQRPIVPASETAHTEKEPPRQFDPNEPVKVHKPDQAERAALRAKKEKYNSNKRQKPGAALARAQREKISIVPSEGKKVVFE